MNSDEVFPVAKAVPRVDSFEVLDMEGPELSEDERAWPVVGLQARSDSFEALGAEPEIGGQEVVIRVRCAASATADEVRAFAEQLRSAVEGVRPAGWFPVQISLPTQAH